MPSKNTERHKSSKGTLLAIFEKRKVRWEKEEGRGEEEDKAGRGAGRGGSLFILLLCRHPVSL